MQTRRPSIHFSGWKIYRFSPGQGRVHRVEQRIRTLEAKRVWVNLGEVENFTIIHAHVKSEVEGKHQRILLDFLDSIEREVEGMHSMIALDSSVAKHSGINNHPAHAIFLNGGAVVSHSKTLEVCIVRSEVLRRDNWRIRSRGICGRRNVLRRRTRRIGGGP